MYRESQESFARTIERLERENDDLRAALRPRRGREGILRGITAVSLVGAALAGAACASAEARAEGLEQQWGAVVPRMASKTRDLGVCEELAEARTRAVEQCRVDLWQETSARKADVATAAPPASTYEAGSCCRMDRGGP